MHIKKILLPTTLLLASLALHAQNNNSENPVSSNVITDTLLPTATPGSYQIQYLEQANGNYMLVSIDDKLTAEIERSRKKNEDSLLYISTDVRILIKSESSLGEPDRVPVIPYVFLKWFSE